jgi:hypothetical protein
MNRRTACRLMGSAAIGTGLSVFSRSSAAQNESWPPFSVLGNTRGSTILISLAGQGSPFTLTPDVIAPLTERYRGGLIDVRIVSLREGVEAVSEPIRCSRATVNASHRPPYVGIGALRTNLSEPGAGGAQQATGQQPRSVLAGGPPRQLLLEEEESVL